MERITVTIPYQYMIGVRIEHLFNNHLMDHYGFIDVAGESIPPQDILFMMRRDQYREMCAEWAAEKVAQGALIDLGDGDYANPSVVSQYMIDRGLITRNDLLTLDLNQFDFRGPGA